MEEVILVDHQDNPIGTCEKMEAHQKGLLHRAFSVLIFNSKGEMLIQRRAGQKYHSPNLWTNACCSHPRPNEAVIDAAIRRCREEIGLSVQPTLLYHFIYKVVFENGLTENELDHVLRAQTDELPILNPKEASDYRYVSFEDLKNEISANPNQFTIWFKQIMQNMNKV